MTGPGRFAIGVMALTFTLHCTLIQICQFLIGLYNVSLSLSLPKALISSCGSEAKAAKGLEVTGSTYIGSVPLTPQICMSWPWRLGDIFNVAGYCMSDSCLHRTRIRHCICTHLGLVTTRISQWLAAPHILTWASPPLLPSEVCVGYTLSFLLSLCL